MKTFGGVLIALAIFSILVIVVNQGTEGARHSLSIGYVGLACFLSGVLYFGLGEMKEALWRIVAALEQDE
jgi:hypothetical protein